MHPNDGFPSARALRVGAAAVAGIIVLLAGLVIGRATASGSSGPSTSGGTSPTPPAPAVPAWAAGATRMDHGVPVGYAHTRDGALAAARNYDLALSATPLSLDPAAYRDAVAFLDVPSSRDQDAAKVERYLANAAPLITAVHQGHPTRFAPFVITSRVESYSATDAQVDVWGGVVASSDGVLAPRLQLVLTTYSLRWLGDWRIVESAGSDGPGVAATTSSAQTNALPPELGREFNGIGDFVP